MAPSPAIQDLAVALLTFTGNGPSLSLGELEALVARRDELPERICDITRRGGRRVFRELHKKTSTAWYEFNLDTKRDFQLAVVAGMVDNAVSKHKPTLVPKEMSEGDYFSNYFSHVLALRRDVVLETILDGGCVMRTAYMEPIHVYNFSTFVGTSPSSPRASLNLMMLETEITNVNLPFTVTSTSNREREQEEDLDVMAPQLIDSIQACDALLLCLEFDGPMRFLDLVCDDRSRWCHALSGDEWLDLARLMSKLPTHDDFFTEAPSTPHELLTSFRYRADRDERASGELTMLSPVIRDAYPRLVPLFCTETDFWTNTLIRVAGVITTKLFSKTEVQ